MNTEPRKHRRGETSSERPGLVFWRYDHGREVWITPEKLETMRRHDTKVSVARHKVRYHTEPDYKKRQLLAITNWHRRNRIKGKIARDKWRAKPGSLDKCKLAYDRWVSRPEGRIVRRKVTARYRGTINGTIINRIRSRIWQALKKGFTKSASTLELVGCSMLDFRQHIEKQFLDGMSWDNVGVWEIDHITPLSAFDLSSPAQQKLAFRYTNCRPLWKNLNRQKSDKIEGELFRGRDICKIIPFKAA